MSTFEVNFDGIVGPTHHYAGLSYGNIASMAHGGSVSYPKEAALQGLKKMKMVADLGVKQAILPPQGRPNLNLLREMGFLGTDERILLDAMREAPQLLYACSSASSMWAANSAIMTPSSDCSDGRAHFTIANLLNRFHRSIEARETQSTFQHLFGNEKLFKVHPPLHKGGRLGDEGAANHTRFCKEQCGKGVHLFVYSSKAFEEGKGSHFPHRQSLEAHQAIVRRHGLAPEQVVFAEQNPEIIEQGIFHNDVISVGHENLFLLHEKAFADTHKVLKEIDEKLYAMTGASLEPHIIREQDLSVKRAVETYLFNSQIINKSILLAPLECETLPLYLPFKEIHYVNLRESMRNGGGPACLRLRVVLTLEQLNAIPEQYLLTDSLYTTLVGWVEEHYRETLLPADLGDPSLLLESERALMALKAILNS